MELQCKYRADLSRCQARIHKPEFSYSTSPLRHGKTDGGEGRTVTARMGGRKKKSHDSKCYGNLSPCVATEWQPDGFSESASFVSRLCANFCFFGTKRVHEKVYLREKMN